MMTNSTSSQIQNIQTKEIHVRDISIENFGLSRAGAAIRQESFMHVLFDTKENQHQLANEKTPINPTLIQREFTGSQKNIFMTSKTESPSSSFQTDKTHKKVTQKDKSIYRY